MDARLEIGDIAADVEFKDIKNVHLSVLPPAGRVRISAPSHMKLDTVRVFAISKLAWIKRQQKQLQAQERETPRQYVDRESHYLWGKRYLLAVVETDAPPRVAKAHSKLTLHVRPGASTEQRAASMAQWHRDEIKAVARPMIDKWSARMGVTVEKLHVQRMKTKWGSCNPANRAIRLNSELAKKPKACLEYIVVHELAHLLEPTHNARFLAIMDRFMPEWQIRRDQLNQLPVRHEDWRY